jgi:serine protein kinase
VRIKGVLNPACRLIFRELMNHYKGDWSRVIEHVRVKRLVLSETDRVGIGTFQPKDEKNQDSTELTGDINYKKIALFGSDSDPRAFNFDGEFNIANRGIIEFIEILKLDVAFLYDLLGATQEHKIKPKKFPQTDIDEVIIGHTNEAEYKKLLNNEFMEALRDRTIKVDIPYITRLKEEVKIYMKDFTNEKVRGKHIAPHTIEVAAMWAILTRLEDPKKEGLSLLQKLKLYDGKTLPGYTQDNVKELRKATVREGMDGISPRYVQDKISNALVSGRSETSSTPSWSSTSWRAASSSTRSSPTKSSASTTPTCWPSCAASTRRSSRTRCSAPSRPTRTPSSACAATTSITSRPTPSARRSRTSTPARTSRPMSA